MVFNSFSFIFLYLPIVLVLHRILRHFDDQRLTEGLLVLASCVFYGMFGVKLLLILLLLAAAGWCCFLLMGEEKNRKDRIVLISGVLIQLMTLAFFKYAGALDIEGLPAAAMPVGLSFYTFALISFLMDRYQGRISKCTLLEYLTFALYFPKLAEGPIAYFHEILDPIREGRDGGELCPFTEGVILFIIGLAKKVLLADALAPVVDYGYQMTYYLNWLSALIAAASFILQLYFDFSGYCDMACGISLMLGIRLPVNFLSPFKAVSIREFWKKWHITLSRFLTDHVYIPLGGSRKGAARTIINTLIVFLISGIWHGSTAGFVIWGLLQGIGVAFCSLGFVRIRNFTDRKYLQKKIFLTIPRGIGIFVNFWFYAFSMIFFRAQDLSYALRMFRELFDLRQSRFLIYMAQQLSPAELYPIRALLELKFPDFQDAFALLTLAVFLLICVLILTGQNSFEIAEQGLISNTGEVRVRRCILLAVLLVWSVISLGGVSTFLYFKF